MKRVLRTLAPSNALLAEQSTLFVSVLKWSVLASITGAMVGGATSLFLYLLGVFTGLGDKATRGHSYLLLPAMIPIVVFIIRKLAPTAEGHGTEKVIEAVHTRDGATDIKVVPVKLFATLLTLGAGGSVGKEGPAAQIGAGLAYSFAKVIQTQPCRCKAPRDMRNQRRVRCRIRHTDIRSDIRGRGSLPGPVKV